MCAGTTAIFSDIGLGSVSVVSQEHVAGAI